MTQAIFYHFTTELAINLEGRVFYMLFIPGKPPRIAYRHSANDRIRCSPAPVDGAISYTVHAKGDSVEQIGTPDRYKSEYKSRSAGLISVEGRLRSPAILRTPGPVPSWAWRRTCCKG